MVYLMMTLKQFRRLVDRIDHRHDDKRVMFSSDTGDFDVDEETALVFEPDRLFIFLNDEE